jgi:hypothetical protein
VPTWSWPVGAPTGASAPTRNRAAVADANLTVAELDFASLSSVASFADWFEGEYDAWGAYGQAKLANLLFAYELDRRPE